MNSIPQYVKRGATGPLRHATPIVKAKTHRSGARTVFAVCIGFGCFIFFVGFSTGLFVLFNVLIRGGV
ncbi:MAG: hypothetical protein EOO69_04650 [Moraxellaceae bacterium]|nr:MAG: hypothetical protein EOO69_04650 [Moraxellaceae bacterium]